MAEKTCPKCGEIKPLSAFTIRRSGKRVGQPVAHCKACNVSANKERKERDPTVYRRSEWPSKLKRLYGITVDDYFVMLEKQGNRCATCGADKASSRHYSRSGRHEMFHVDHCHTTGKVRGLLCGKCNTAIGLIGDRPDVAEQISKYLRGSK